MPRVVIVQPNRSLVSETFLCRHAEGLDAPVIYLEQGRGPAIDGEPVLSQGWLSCSRRRLVRKVLRRRRDQEKTAGFIRAFRQFGAEAILAEYGTMAVSVLDACAALRLPLVVHFHGYDASKHHILAKYREDYRRLFREAAAIVVVSRAMFRRIGEIGGSEEKIACIPYGVDANQFEGADPGNASPRFLCVGRMVEKKAPHLTLAAFQNVLREAPEARLRMIGDGPLLPICRDLAAGLGIAHAVEFLGSQSHEVVRDEMRQARAFLQHSVEAADGDCEGTPVAVLEAGMAGLPVVATRHGGIMDVVREAETGLLGDERDVNAMAANITTLIRNPELAGQYGENARAHVLAHYSTEMSTAKLLAVMEAAAKGRPLARLDDTAGRDRSGVASTTTALAGSLN